MISNVHDINVELKIQCNDGSQFVEMQNFCWTAISIMEIIVKIDMEMDMEIDVEIPLVL